MRGAADGLSLVVPHADPVYYAARPGISIAADQLLARDGMFGLHPSLAPLLPLWQSGRLAAVHATGLPAANRSHFSAMEEIEDASAGSSTRVGWLNRLIGLDALTSPVQGIGLGSGVVPTSLAGPSPAMSASSLDKLTIPGEEDGHAARRRASLETLWGSDRSVLGTAARDTFTAVDTLGPVVAGSSTPPAARPIPGATSATRSPTPRASSAATSASRSSPSTRVTGTCTPASGRSSGASSRTTRRPSRRRWRRSSPTSGPSARR